MLLLRKNLRFSFLVLFLFIVYDHSLIASHLRSADITVEQVCNTFTYKITVTAYLNSQSNTKFGTRAQVTFGDGSSVTIPEITATLRPDLGENISVAKFTTTHTYSSAGTYTIMYYELHRNAGILNVADSKDVAYVSFVTLKVNSSIGCNHYPVLSVVPVDLACTGITFFHNPGAYDVDGDSLSYELSVPASDATTYATYESPISSTFYLNYNTGNEAGTGPPLFSIDALTGLITWDAPGMSGEYNIAFKVLEWRKNSSGVYEVLSTTTRDMQIIVKDCANTRPELIIPDDTCVVAGTTLIASIKGTDHENNNVKIEAYSEALEFDASESPATYSPDPAVFVSSNPYAESTFEWNTICAHVRSQPYQVVFKITDNPASGPDLVTYKTWSIRVVGPAPVWDETTLDLVNRHAILKWQPYTCTNAVTIEVWRKVGSYSYTHGNCELGLSRYGGYEFIGEVSASETSFADTNSGHGLAVGAQYCYRLVAKFEDTYSYVSEEACIGPIQADAPVITHVSIEKTDPAGNVRVSWRSPFNINETQFPKPYQYEVYRAEDFIGETNIALASGRISDTTFLDTGIDTKGKILNYRIVLYTKPSGATDYIATDTSSVASSVRLSVIAGKNSITLSWRDSIPWSNVVSGRPYHLIYRGEGVSLTDSDLVLLDSINVEGNDFIYNDEGLEEDKIYSYRILTRGTYGNPAIALQENFSQMISTYPLNDLVTCAPIAKIKPTDCNEYITTNTCAQSSFSNTVSWVPVETSGCRSDVISYNIYASSTVNGELILIASGVTDTVFSESGLASFARCYKIAAVDSRGKEGALSDATCNDNCPYYELPNIFTPNDDGCNDVFSAHYDSDEAGSCGVAEVTKCPRFVNVVSIHFYNRWGKEVYHYSSGDNNSIYINWNGKDSDGNDLGNGIYYYSADVVFDVVDPSKSKRNIKGWVHLLR